MPTEYGITCQFSPNYATQNAQKHLKKPLKLAVLGILLREIWRKLIRSAIFRCHFLFLLCLIKAAGAGPFDSMFDVREK
jgi:hypothetical protein